MTPRPTDPTDTTAVAAQGHRADPARVAEVMAAVAAGQTGAVFVLHAEFGPSIQSAVRRALRQFGVDGLDPDDLNGLVMEATLAIADAAGSWHPGGALPWWWAYNRIRQIVSRFLGQFSVAYDPQLHGGLAGDIPQAWMGEEPTMLELIDAMAETDSDVALLRDAFAEVPGSARDREILLVYTNQQRAGDHSPAETVAPMFGLTPAAVRQVVKRTRDRLRTLATTNPRFEPLCEFALVA
jgi:hypothetical protein